LSVRLPHERIEAAAHRDTAATNQAGSGVIGAEVPTVAEFEAFESFVRRNTSALLRTAFLLTGNHHRAEELLQDTLTHLYPRWSQVQAADLPLAYVRRVLANRFVSAGRPKSSREVVLWELPDGWDGTDFTESDASRRQLWELLGGLPERQRAAIVLRYFNDLSDDQVAETIGCRTATVRSLISRGIRTLRGDKSGVLTLRETEAS
jgi:RNA polymerase sigma-70 factor (sigma-E family)